VNDNNESLLTQQRHELKLNEPELNEHTPIEIKLNEPELNEHTPIELKLNEPELNGHTPIELKLNEPKLNGHTLIELKLNEPELNRHTNKESIQTQKRNEAERHTLLSHNQNVNDNNESLLTQQRHECEELIPQERNERDELIPQQRNECDELIPQQRHECDELIPQQRHECDELIPQERNECDELIPQQLPYEQTDLDPPDTILMTSDDAQWALDVIHEINDEKSKLTSDLRQLEQEGEQVHQHAMDQLHDDIIHEEDASIDRIINAFESLPHSDSDDGSVADYIRAHYRDVPDPPDPSADDLDENTDTEDDADEVIGLLGANQEFMQASQKFLRVNQEFIALFGRQRNTIARLRARISRLVCQLHNASCAQNETIETTNPKTDSEDLHEEIATVLMDINRDISLILKPNCDSNAKMDFHQFGFPHHPRVKKELKLQLAKIQAHENTDSQLWMYYDSGASRSVISTGSPIRKHLKGLTPSYGSCSIGNGTPLQYIEKGHVDNNLEITVVQDLKYDLFSSVSAAKNGLTSIIDFDLRTGQNNSYTIDKATGAITPLVERGKGILELPLHLMFETGTCLISTQVLPASSAELSPNLISTFWHHYDDDSFDPITRNNNRTEYSLFTFDVLKSLNEREQHFLIHARLGHLPRKSIMQMIKNGTTGIAQYSGKFKELCKPCLQAKQRAENHGHEHKRHPHGRPGEHLHSDLAVLSTLDLNGNKYVLTVVDEISHEIVVALLKRKTAEDVCRISKKIQLLISARTGNKLLTWQFDRGTEFLNSAFEAWLKMDLGVVQRFSNVEHPWENGVAERSFQTLFSLSRSLLKHADLPDRLWGKAVLHSVYLSNRSPTAGLGGIAPLQFRTKEPIDLTHMRVFGSPAQIFVRATIRDDVKLSDRSVSGTFVGISDKGNGYIFLVSKSNEVVEIDAKDAKFNETFADIRERKGKLTNAHYISPDLTEVTDKDPDDQNCDGKQERNSDQLYQQPQGEDDGNDGSNGRRRRQVTPRKFLLPGTHLNQSLTPPEAELNIRRQQYLNVCLDNTIADTDAIFVFDCMTAQRNTESKLTKELELLNACLYNEQPHNMLLSAIMQANEVNLNIADPKSQGEIDKMEPNDAKRFNDATTYEVKGMKNKDVFENITMNDLPRGTPIYQSIVNWTSKTNLGVYVKTKCRICFGGHRYDKSFSDTFAPTVNFCTVLIMICLSAMFRWYLGSLDYSQAYLNADIDELCVMRAPIAVREFNSQGQEYYWKMKKAIYGHPKASRLWADCLHKKLLELGYCQFLTDQCVYGRWTNWDANGIHNNEIPKHSSFIFLLIHSDDIIIVSHDEHVMNNAKAELLQVFEGTDNGNLKSFCGVEVNVNDNQISLSMEYYWKKLMTKFNIEPDDIENSPLKTKIKRSECPAEPDEQLKTSYLQIIGSIIYGYTHCRLDLAFPVNMLTRVMHSPAEQHYNLLKKLLYYINGTKDWTLNYFKDDTVFYGMDLTFFCNVDSAHADDDESHRSTGGWFFFLRQGQGAVAAKSGQTKDIPLSSTESETIWGSNAAMQGAFIKQFLDETKLFRNTSFELHEDSQPMINAQKRNVSQSRFKHIKTKHHYIRKLIFDGWCKLVKIPTKMNTADMATKILPAKTVSIFSRVVLGLQDTLPYFTESEQY
jgi:transposase InsO family protein